MDGANKFIPKSNYKIIPAFTPSTKTRNLINISIKDNLHKHNITEEVKNMLNNIQRQIQNSTQQDSNTFWIKKIKGIRRIQIHKKQQKTFQFS